MTRGNWCISPFFCFSLRLQEDIDRKMDLQKHQETADVGLAILHWTQLIQIREFERMVQVTTADMKSTRRRTHKLQIQHLLHCCFQNRDDAGKECWPSHWEEWLCWDEAGEQFWFWSGGASTTLVAVSSSDSSGSLVNGCVIINSTGARLDFWKL